MKHILIRSTLIGGLVMAAVSANAAGYQLSEYSAAGMGRSFAGAGVVGDDFSAIGFNPAGMSLNETNGMQAGASMVSIASDFKGEDGLGNKGAGDTRITRVLPNGFAQYQLNDKTTVGLGVYIPFGLATDYDNGWFGETHGGLSQITALNVSPALSYKVNDVVSLGASVNMQHAAVHITGAGYGGAFGLPNNFSKDLSGDDWGVGYTLGITVKPVKKLTLGASYRSKISHHLQGKVKMGGFPAPMAAANRKYDISAKVTTPETVLFSGAYEATDKLTLSATARWTRWSRFESLDIIAKETILGQFAPGEAISSTHENWKNTWFYALGADYKVNDAWTVRVGAAYDETVIKAPEFRTTRIPDGRRVWTSLGLSYAFDNMQIDAGYAHLFIHGGSARGGDTVYKPNIKYSSHADMLSLGFQYKF